MGKTTPAPEPVEPPARLTLRDRQRQYTRARLMEIGREMLERNGYAATKVEDIAAAADASRATFYLHFRTKQELVDAISETVDPDFVGHYRALDEYLATTRRPTRARMRAWLAHAYAWWADNAAFVQVIRQAHAVESGMPHVDDFTESRVLIASMVHWLDRPPEQQEVNRQRAMVLERMTAHLFEELALGHYRLDEDVALDLLADLWLDVFRRPVDAARR